MIERSPGASSAPVRDLSSRTPQSARADDPDAAKRFGELVGIEPEAKGPQSKDRRIHRRPADTRDRETDANPFAQLAGTEGVAPKVEHTDTRREPRDAIREQASLDQPQARAQTAAAPAEARTLAAAAPFEVASFTAMLDRVHLQQAQANSQTVLSMNDARWLAHEAVVTQSNAGGLSLSLSMNMRHGSNEALDELRRRLEARGLTVDHVTTRRPLDF
jgi:hypothetical protein